jgi:predicted nucleotide-binding protein (sugar kinase/HSP70/actin superfamily)
MQSTATEHYRAYRPRPFTRADRDEVTILFGGLHWRAERLIQGALENLGYRTRVLPTATRDDLLTGREVADIGQCCPTSFTTGNLANFLRDEVRASGAAEVARKYAYVTAGACGACRFGQYHQSYELALRNVGMDAFRMFLLAQNGLDQGAAEGGGLELNLPFTLGAIWAVIVADLVQDLEYQVRPYEVKPGATERVARAGIEHLFEVFRTSPAASRRWDAPLWYLGTRRFVRALKDVGDELARIEVDRLRVKPVVKITGEFYLQTVEGDPNYNIHRWLEAEGAEVYPAAIAIWLDYLLRHAGQDYQDHIGLQRGARLKAGAVRTGQRMLRFTYDRMRRALGGLPHEMPDQHELRALAAPYFHSRLNGGEGDMLVGKALWAHHHRKAHMICELSPYSCMPNTMSIGAMAAVTGKHPGLLYAPLEIKGDAEIHALSRCQMILTEAKRRAQREFDDALGLNGLTLEKARDLLETRPEMKSAMYRVPRGAAAGTAASLVAHLAAITRPLTPSPGERGEHCRGKWSRTIYRKLGDRA